MNVLEFGDAKLALNDIDPLYLALHCSNLPLAVRQRYTLAEVMFDLAGLAADIARADNFWDACHEAARQTLRGAPRRYFRGSPAHFAIDDLAITFGSAEGAIESLHGTFTEVNAHILAFFPQFGPCAAFKLADMAERVCRNKIDFSEVTATQICNSKQVWKGFEKAETSLNAYGSDLIKRMKRHWNKTMASPRFDRPLNAQEFESILCYYSHDERTSKHLPGMDSEGIRKELLMSNSPLAKKIASKLP